MQKLLFSRCTGDLAFFVGGALHPGRRLVDGWRRPELEPGRKLVGVSLALLVLELAFVWFHPEVGSGRRLAGEIISGLALAGAWAVL